MNEEILEYKTIIPTKSTVLYKDKGSKFIGYIFQANSQIEVDESLQKVKSEHPQARHICYAYTFGIAEKTVKINDDGEPKHSAGTPIYGQIQSYELDNVLIAVVRYFGGTKLGVPGLIQAYKTTAQDCIEESQIITIERQFLVKISCTYNQISAVYHYLNTHESMIVQQKMEEKCEIWAEFPIKNKNEVINFFTSQPFHFEIINS